MKIRMTLLLTLHTNSTVCAYQRYRVNNRPTLHCFRHIPLSMTCLSTEPVQAHCAWQHPPTAPPATFHVCKTRGCQCSFSLLMMGRVSPETCWASYKYGITNFWYIVASCWIFLYGQPQLMYMWLRTRNETMINTGGKMDQKNKKTQKSLKFDQHVFTKKLKHKKSKVNNMM